MKSKHWFLVAAALILMIVVAPWYMKAQSLTAQEVEASKTAASIAELTNDMTSSGLQVGIIKDRQWHPGDLMLVNWKINDTSYSTSSAIYFEVTGKDLTKDVLVPLGSKSIALMPNPFVWSVPKDFGLGEYTLSSYVYGTSSDPIITGNDVEFTVVSVPVTANTASSTQKAEPSSNVVAGNNSMDSLMKDLFSKVFNSDVTSKLDIGKTTTSGSVTTNSDSLSLTSLDKRVLELEKMVYLLRVQIEELTGKAVEPQDMPTTVDTTPVVEPNMPAPTDTTVTSDHADINSLPVAWSEEYANMTDTDGDGLPDKLETIIGTKIDNPDSDGDGYSDGLEIKKNFDPLTVNKIEIKSTKIDSLEGKTISTTNAAGQTENWLVKDGRKVYLGEVSS